MISPNEVFPIGQIIKPHGIHGEMSFTFTTEVFDEEEVPCFIMEMEGILVPFFIDEYRFKTNTSGLLKLEGIDSEMKARQFIGLTIYLPKTYLEKVEDTEIDITYFAGFELIDKKEGRIGLIAEVDQTTDNILFVIEKEDDELLIPASNEYIESIDHDKKVIHINLPEGLLDL